MAKRKYSVISGLVADRYLIWTIVFAVVVGVGLLTEIARAKAMMDVDISSTMYLVNIKHKN